MKVAYFDCHSGISGDMILGASDRCRGEAPNDSQGAGFS